jgi:hypothetical protein
MKATRIHKVLKSRATLKGAEARLHRAIGFGSPGNYNPSLLFDDLRSTRPTDYRPGLLWHAHHRLETTYVLAGQTEHEDTSMTSRARCLFSSARTGPGSADARHTVHASMREITGRDASDLAANDCRERRVQDAAAS